MSMVTMPKYVKVHSQMFKVTSTDEQPGYTVKGYVKHYTAKDYVKV